MVYTDLRAAIQQYCENYEDSFAERIDTFITQAENRIAHLVRLPPHRKMVMATFLAGDRIIQPPADFLSVDSIFVLDLGRQWSLTDKEPEFIDVCFPLAADRGHPRFHAKIDDKSLLLGPTADKDYIAQMQYFAPPPGIKITGRSWLGDRAEFLLLYGSLVEAYTYMKGEMELLQWYDAKFKEAVNLLKGFGDGRARKDSLGRTGPEGAGVNRDYTHVGLFSVVLALGAGFRIGRVKS